MKNLRNQIEKVLNETNYDFTKLNQLLRVQQSEDGLINYDYFYQKLMANYSEYKKDQAIKLPEILDKIYKIIDKFISDGQILTTEINKNNIFTPKTDQKKLNLNSKQNLKNLQQTGIINDTEEDLYQKTDNNKNQIIKRQIQEKNLQKNSKWDGLFDKLISIFRRAKQSDTEIAQKLHSIYQEKINIMKESNVLEFNLINFLQLLLKQEIKKRQQNQKLEKLITQINNQLSLNKTFLKKNSLEQQLLEPFQEQTQLVQLNQLEYLNLNLVEQQIVSQLPFRKINRLNPLDEIDHIKMQRTFQHKDQIINNSFIKNVQNQLEENQIRTKKKQLKLAFKDLKFPQLLQLILQSLPQCKIRKVRSKQIATRQLNTCEKQYQAIFESVVNKVRQAIPEKFLVKNLIILFQTKLRDKINEERFQIIFGISENKISSDEKQEIRKLSKQIKHQINEERQVKEQLYRMIHFNFLQKILKFKLLSKDYGFKTIKRMNGRDIFFQYQWHRIIERLLYSLKLYKQIQLFEEDLDKFYLLDFLFFQLIAIMIMIESFVIENHLIRKSK